MPLARDGSDAFARARVEKNARAQSRVAVITFWLILAIVFVAVAKWLGGFPELTTDVPWYVIQICLTLLVPVHIWGRIEVAKAARDYSSDGAP